MEEIRDNVRNPAQPMVGIIIGSATDWPRVEPAAKVLRSLQVSFEVIAASAHRSPDRVAEWTKAAEGRGIRVIIAAAGLAAHLPGVVASHTTLPVIGLPLAVGPLAGQDALLSIVQMPPGVPVAAVAIDGAENAGLLATRILALGDPELAERLAAHRRELAEKVASRNAELQAKLAGESA